MSDTTAEIIIRTGPDPRERPEFEAIRLEINKINHPAQPEVNWNLIESLALTLFRTHGVDLQTAVYYTLARSHKEGLSGFTEGCELLSAMIVHQWEQLWPEQPQARTEILEWFNARVGSIVRQHPFTRNDLQMLYRAERALQLLSDKLQQVELKRVPRIENLLYLMQNTIKRLEPPASVAKPAPVAGASKKMTLVYLAESEPEPVQQKTAEDAFQPSVRVQVMPPMAPVPKRYPALWGFTGGLLFGAVIMTFFYFTSIKPAQQRLNDLASRPEGAVQLWLSQPEITGYGEQLTYLEKLSPLAGLQTADSLLATARQRWPSDATQLAESQRWERLLQTRAAGSGVNNSYFQAQSQLQALSAKLIEQEKARGGLTISYLKTAVYQLQTELNRATPLEELLRQYSVALDNHQPVSYGLKTQIDERFNTLLSYYHQLATQDK